MCDSGQPTKEIFNSPVESSKNSRSVNPIFSRRHRRSFRCRRNALIVIWSLVIAYYSVVNAQDNERTSYPITNISLRENEAETPVDTSKSNRGSSSNISKYAEWEDPGVTCTPPGIDDFPEDIFTQAERQNGYVIVHFMISIYIFIALAIVCDDYFVPSMERICDEMSMPSDVAGATFMAIATSAPELFTNIIGTFITHGDIGVGTIVGSAVFNILAVAAVCGMGAGMVVPLEWWSVTRDCLCYSVAVILLLIVLRDEQIYWYEALILVLVYVIYIIVMYQNSSLKRGAEKLVRKIHKRCSRSQKAKSYNVDSEKGNDVGLSENQTISMSNGGVNGVSAEKSDMTEIRDEVLLEQALKNSITAAEEEKEDGGLFRPPTGQGCRAWAEWVIGWPIKFLFVITVPDCREEKWSKWYPLTFAMCILWIGTLSYVVNWMMTIIGHTLRIPDSVMGLTFIAAGTSVPEIVSSLIVARQGLGTMAVSNSIGSNTFDVLMCLGIPWLIRGVMLHLHPDGKENYIQINSRGLEYSTIMLFTSLAVLYVILFMNKFQLDRKVGFLSLILYIGFLIMASLFELNVFFEVNLPTCQYYED